MKDEGRKDEGGRNPKSDLAMTDPQKDLRLIFDAIRDCCKSLPQEDIVALYIYGSHAAGERDSFSDIDVALIADEEKLSAGRRWAVQLSGLQAWKLDPVLLDVTQIGDAASWDVSFILAALKANAILVLGRDLRNEIIFPAEDKLRLCMVFPALISARRFYNVPCSEKLAPAVFEIGSCTDAILDQSKLLELSKLAIHFARANVYFEAGIFAHDKQDLLKASENLADGTLCRFLSSALLLRKRLAAGEPDGGCTDLADALLSWVPCQISRLMENMLRFGIDDPTFQGIR